MGHFDKEFRGLLPGRQPKTACTVTVKANGMQPEKMLFTRHPNSDFHPKVAHDHHAPW